MKLKELIPDNTFIYEKYIQSTAMKDMYKYENPVWNN